ncbi:MAG TPA: hypothetical protein VGL26_04310 [Jatrophihabitans sp.]|jgi:hypothetical protein
MPYFIISFFRGIKNIFFRKYSNPQKTVDGVFNEQMQDPLIQASVKSHLNGSGFSGWS